MKDVPVHYERGQMASGNMSLDEFTDKVMELLTLAWGEGSVTFTQEEPIGNSTEAMPMPVITYDTPERVRSESHKSLDPILFDSIRDPDDPGATVKRYRMWFDTEMEFKIYHTTNREARILMEEFETFLFTYKGYFKHLGISDIIFLAETKPMVTTAWQKEIPTRTLRYLVRIERITTIRSNALQKATPVRNESAKANQGNLINQNPIIDNYRDQQRIRN